MELEDAIEYVEVFLEYEKWYAHSGNDEDFLRGIDKTAIEKILEHLKKQEKMIDRMAKALHLFIWKNDEKIIITSRPKVSCHTLSIEEIKQYFEKKAEEE